MIAEINLTIGETISLDENNIIQITIVNIATRRVYLGIEAPKIIPVLRAEIFRPHSKANAKKS